MEDLTGRVFGGLQVLEQDKEQENFWRCRCGCGREVSVSGKELLDGTKRSCGCGRKRLHCGDITGMRSGRLVAVRPTDQKRRSSVLWLCKCDCGGEILAEPYKIRNKVIASCGCIRTEKKIKDITGQRFGRLVALERLNKKRGSSFLWRCQCDCGKTVETSANSLLSGNTRSCGCLRIEAIRRTMDTDFARSQGPENLYVAAAYTGDAASAQEWKGELEEAFPGYEIYMAPLSLSVACHIGPGARAVTVTKLLHIRDRR